MKIKGMKLLLGGLKGMEITYEDLSVTKDGNFLIERPEKNHTPVPKEIKDKVKQLGFYLLDLCSYPLANIKNYVADETVVVNGYSVSDDGFVLKGKMATNNMVNAKIFSLTTPNIRKMDGYEKHEDVELLILEINKMIKVYLSGGYKVDVVQTAIDFAEAKNVNDFDLTGMSDKEALEAATIFLEKKGCLVMQPSDYTTETEAPSITVDAPVEKTKKMAKVA